MGKSCSNRAQGTRHKKGGEGIDWKWEWEEKHLGREKGRCCRSLDFMRVRAAAACPQMPLLVLSSAVMQAGARSQIEHAMHPACARWMMGRRT